jgi:acyl-CoA reductase-like NAD-dependent aldehyde dehydrogenase
VEQEIYDPFVAKVVEKVKRLRLGAGSDPETDLGPMIRERQMTMLEQQLSDAVNKGAKILCGGKRRPDLGPLLFEPRFLSMSVPI